MEERMVILMEEQKKIDGLEMQRKLKNFAKIKERAIE